MAQGTVSISIDELRVGVTCSHPIEDDHGVLLLGADTKITEPLIVGLRDRGIKHVEVDPRDLVALRGTGKKKSAVKREEKTDEGWVKSRPVKEMLVDRYDEGFNKERTEELCKAMDEAKERFEELRTRLSEEQIRSVSEFIEISNSYARSMVDDHDQTIGVIGTVAKNDNPEERAVRLSVLGMAVAIELGLDGPQTLEVGMTALLHDIGLYAMDPKFRKPVETMSEAERWEYRKHPLISVICISDVMDIPASVQLAMQQVHEQFDGSGFPRGVRGHRIHSYARILNVVDSYLQLTTETASRQPLVPHDALGLMLHQASRGLFDPKVMRAFLNIETLFPLGSMVELSSGAVARVIRRPKDGFASPVLEDLEGNRIELEGTDITVVRPFCDPEANQVRLMPHLMPASKWHPANHAAL